MAFTVSLFEKDAVVASVSTVGFADGTRIVKSAILALVREMLVAATSPRVIEGLKAVGASSALVCSAIASKAAHELCAVDRCKL